MTRAVTRAALALLLALVPACFSFAPPIRTGHYGAPGRMDEGMVEAAGGVVYRPELSGGPMVGYGVTKAVSVEAGAEIDRYYRGIGYLGARYTPLRPEGRPYAFVLDVEGGAGAGVGGRRCADGECDASALNLRRPAGGAYLGLGIGGKLRFFSPWLRLRTQVSGAEGLPATSVSTAVAGVQFDITELAHIYAGTGFFILANQIDYAYGWLALDAGLSFTIATPRTKRARAQAQSARAQSAQAQSARLSAR